MSIQKEVAVVMDVGGTWIRGALADDKGRILWHCREPSRTDSDTEGLVAKVEQIARQAVAQAGTSAIRGIGIALASPMDPITGVMHSPPNLPELDGVSFNSRWGESLGARIVAGNDANLAALAEYTYGAGKNARTLVYITISTGIGGGIVLDGDIFLGASGMAGEVGHMCVELDGPPCRCGGAGCLEAIASGTAIAEAARSRIDLGEDSLIPSLVASELEQVAAPAVFTAAAQGDRLARDIVGRAGRALGTGLANLVHIFNPDLIAIGGSVSLQWDVLWPIIEPHMLNQTMKPFRPTFRVVRSSLGDDIGLLGAAALVWRSLTPHTDRPSPEFGLQ